LLYYCYTTVVILPFCAVYKYTYLLTYLLTAAAICYYYYYYYYY